MLKRIIMLSELLKNCRLETSLMESCVISKSIRHESLSLSPSLHFELVK